ncbi:MAG: DUF481 domain-containing protein [Epsilonproteobacteria bacterium]|nr:MAG: DUF481 domain-containing protein [Campylobacterota bacterium]
MKYIILIGFLLLFSLFAEEVKEEVSPEIIEVKDTSGLSDDEVREVANEKNEAVKVEAKEVIKTIIDGGYDGDIDISKIQNSWEQQSPTPKKYDWVQTKSGEWFKGEIKAMYRDKLEFDSDEIGLYTFDFEDIVQIKSYNIIGVNIEDVAIFTGIVRFKDDKVTIIQGDNTFDFERSQIISLAPEGNNFFDYWSGKITLNIDFRKGNKNQYDFVAKANIKRRTSDSNLYFDYLGRVSSLDDSETANDHRINQKYDRYITRNFFWTPLFAEYYQDKFQNIDNQVTAGVGIGYTIVDNKWIEWDVSGGPAYTYIKYISVTSGSDTATSPAFELSTKLDIEVTSRVDFKYDYKLTVTDRDAGTYKHHMVGVLENEITSWLDLDLTFIWDHLHHPERADTGIVPVQNDYQVLVGLGVEF